MKKWGWIFLACVAGARAQDWPQWLGPTRDAHPGPGFVFPSALPAELPLRWKIKVGGGFSSPVVARGKLAYCDEDGKDEIIHLVEAATGKEIWHTAMAARFEDEWGGGPRSTPMVDGDRVYAQSCNGEFCCLNLGDGKVVWRSNFEKDFGVKFLGSKVNEGTAIRRGNNGSGIVEGTSVIVPVGGTHGASVVCFDKLSGKVQWRGGDDEAAYSSLRVATIAGARQVIAFTAEALCGFDRQSGKILWRVPLKTNAKRHAATPVIFGDNICVNSHTLGIVCFAIRREGSGFRAEEKWVNKDARINLSTPVLVGGHLYCQGAGTDFICVDAQTGEQKWSHPSFSRDIKKASSSVMASEDKVLALNYEGVLHLIAADPKEYRELGRAQVCGNNWNFPALAEKCLFVRDQRELACYKFQ